MDSDPPSIGSFRRRQGYDGQAGAPEAALLARCRRGEPDAWDELFDLHYAAAGRFIFQLAPDFTREDAEEICQEVFLSVIKNLGSFHGESRFQTWLFRIAANQARDYREKRNAAKRGGGQTTSRCRPKTRKPASRPIRRPTRPGRMTLAMNAEQMAGVRAALDRVGEPCREILELRYFGDLSYEELSTHIALESEDRQFAPEQVSGPAGGNRARNFFTGKPGGFPVQLSERMEPEREIEKLLRAYVRKRRADAGDPLKLHPANRRRLQDEVSRRTPKPEAGGTLWSLLTLFRRPAFVLGVVAVVVVGVSLFLPALGSAKKKAQSMSTLGNLRQIGVAAQKVAENNLGWLPASLDDLSNTLGTRAVLTDSISGKPFVYVAGGKDLKTLSSNTVLAYSPENENGRAVLFADGRVAVVANGNFARLTNPTPVEFALADKVASEDLAKAAVNAPAVAAAPPPTALGAAATPLAVPIVTGDLEMKKTSVTASQTFVQTAAGNQHNLYRNVSTAAQNVPVLQSFQVVQNGDAISVVDRDGSVYQGSVQVAAEAEREEPPPVEEAPGRVSGTLQSRAKEVQSAENRQQAAQNYFFRVAGMNRTLKQNVVFSGNVEALSVATTNGQLIFGGATGGGGGGADAVVQINQPVSTNQLQGQLSNSRLVGTAVINRTNRIEINAVPVAP